MVATNRTAGITQQFRAQTTGQTSSGGTTPSTNTSKNTTNTNDVIANNFLKAPNFGFQNTTIPGQSESARKIGALLQQTPLQQQLGKMISGLIEEGGKMLGSIKKPDAKEPKGKDTQLAQNEPPPPPEPRGPQAPPQ